MILTIDNKADENSCYPSLPSGFTDSGNNTAYLSNSAVPIYSVAFNKPAFQFENTGSLGGDISVTVDNVSGIPIQSRGLYFDSNYQASIQLDLVLYMSFSVHYWINPKSTSSPGSLLECWNLSGDTFHNDVYQVELFNGKAILMLRLNPERQS